MSGELPASEVIRAIGIYLDIAYRDAPANKPADFVGLTSDNTLDDLAAKKGVQTVTGSFVNGRRHPDGLSFRLGNAHYRNMKLVARPTLDSPGFVLGVDTHDEIDPSLVPENQQEQLRTTRTLNRQIAKEIHTAWENEGLPTQGSLVKSHLGRADDRQ